MATQEYYVREASEEEARGPFNVEQLVSLVENGQINEKTLFYDATNERWVSIGDDSETRAILYPEKKKLRTRARPIEAAPRPANEVRAPLTVDDMLAAAEGKTAETKDKEDPLIAMARAAKIGMWAAILTLVASAGSELLPAADAIASLDLGKIAAEPLIFVGGLDLILALLLGLGLVTLYPFVRFRAALGLGFFGFIYFSQGMHMSLLAAFAGSAGLYCSTIFLSMFPVLLAALAGIGGMAAIAYFILSA
jgi:hypothetical protein